MTPYQLQTRQRGGIVIRQGGGYIMLARNEVEALVRDLTKHLGDLRVGETSRIAHT